MPRRHDAQMAWLPPLALRDTERWQPLEFGVTPLLKRNVCGQIRSLEPFKGESHAQETDVSRVGHGVCRWCRPRTGIL
jgi:hypothetical protein